MVNLAVGRIFAGIVQIFLHDEIDARASQVFVAEQRRVRPVIRGDTAQEIGRPAEVKSKVESGGFIIERRAGGGASVARGRSLVGHGASDVATCPAAVPCLDGQVADGLLVCCAIELGPLLANLHTRGAGRLLTRGDIFANLRGIVVGLHLAEDHRRRRETSSRQIDRFEGIADVLSSYQESRTVVEDPITLLDDQVGDVLASM